MRFTLGFFVDAVGVSVMLLLLFFWRGVNNILCFSYQNRVSILREVRQLNAG